MFRVKERPWENLRRWVKGRDSEEERGEPEESQKLTQWRD